MAAIYSLPVVYLCENNQYGMSTSIKKSTKIHAISDRAAAYGMPGVTVDGNDIMAVYEAVSEAAGRGRDGDGPTLIEAITYRWKGHSKNDPGVYRTKDEVEYWKSLDPIKRFRDKLIDDGVITEAEADEIDKAAEQAIEDAYEFAEASPEPSLDTIMEGVYA
jgi:pyruvate dehydrogenase E1 component alpha subunit